MAAQPPSYEAATATPIQTGPYPKQQYGTGAAADGAYPDPSMSINTTNQPVDSTADTIVIVSAQRTDRNEPSAGGSGQMFGASFSDKVVRRRFIMKVYAIISAQLLFTSGIVALFTFHKGIQEYVQVNPGWYYASLGVFFASYIGLLCFGDLRRKVPWNFIFLAVFTIALTYMTGMICTFYQTEAVLIGMGVTCLVVLSLTLFAVQTKIDFTTCSALLFCFSMLFLLLGLTFMMFAIMGLWGRALQIVWGGIGAVLFSLYLIYDTQMIVGGRKYALHEEEYIFGALMIYLDIINLFLLILAIVGGGRK